MCVYQLPEERLAEAVTGKYLGLRASCARPRSGKSASPKEATVAFEPPCRPTQQAKTSYSKRESLEVPDLLRATS